MKSKQKILDRIFELTELDDSRLALPDRIMVSTEKNTLRWVLVDD